METETEVLPFSGHMAREGEIDMLGGEAGDWKVLGRGEFVYYNVEPLTSLNGDDHSGHIVENRQ